MDITENRIIISAHRPTCLVLRPRPHRVEYRHFIMEADSSGRLWALGV